VTSQPQVLIYGQDKTLLETRQWVLEHAGFAVTGSTDLTAIEAYLAAKTFAVFVLCHSLTATDRVSALACSHAQSSDIKNLVLATALPLPAHHRDIILSAYLSPKALIDAVSTLVSQSHTTKTQITV
jgi:hypothetical protein